MLAMSQPTFSELIKAGRRRFRKQQGTIVERSNTFFLRFYRDGENGERIKVTEKLCEKGPDFPSANCRAVIVLRDLRMSQINAERHQTLAVATPLVAEPITIGEFWLQTYLPWVTANKRASTARGYKYVWSLYLKAELSAKPLNGFTTLDCSELLDRLVTSRKLNENTIASVRSLMSGIFKRATNTKGPDGKALIAHNPMRDAQISVKVRKAKPRVKYTLEETAAILNALEQPDAKLFFAFCAVLAMRPEEAAAVRWENIDLKVGKVHVCEAAPYGMLGELKTEQSERDLFFGDDVRSFITAWYTSMGKPKNGLLFTGNGVDPINHNSFAKYRIKPHAKKVCKRWNGCYSGRHGAATRLYNQDGDVRAAYQALGNSFEVVYKTYVEPDTECWRRRKNGPFRRTKMGQAGAR
jgi:integrase